MLLLMLLLMIVVVASGPCHTINTIQWNAFLDLTSRDNHQSHLTNNRSKQRDLSFGLFVSVFVCVIFFL